MPTASGNRVPRQRRVGPFWLEEGGGVVALAAGFLVIVVVLYLAAALTGRT